MRILLAGLALALGGCATDATSGSCDRTCAIALASSIAISGAAPSTARFTENGVETKSEASWFSGATALDLHNQYFADGQAIVVGTGRGKDGVPAVFGLRVKMDGMTPREAELIVAREGEASLAPPSIPVAHDARFQEIVPAAKRTSREAMIAAANEYFDGIETDIGAKIPVEAGCERVENGVQTTHNPKYNNISCNSMEPFAYITEVRERRYPIVDLERGVVVGAVAFYVPGGDYKRMVDGKETTRHYDPRSLFLFEAFKVVDGRIVQIEATMRNVPLGTKMGW